MFSLVPSGQSRYFEGNGWSIVNFFGKATQVLRMIYVVGMIDDKMPDNTAMNDVLYFFCYLRLLIVKLYTVLNSAILVK